MKGLTRLVRVLKRSLNDKHVLALLLLALASALVYQAWHLGVTIDEPSHLMSAHLYWHGADKLYPRDMPPVIKITGGWVAALFDLPVPYDHEIWQTQQEWDIACEMMARMSGDQVQRVYFWSRLPLIVFPLLTALLVWRWSRELFSPWIGVLLAALYALEPTALGHGALFKNDIAATFAYLLFWYRVWKLWPQPSMRNVLWLALALLLAIMSKLSMLVLLAVAPLLIAVRFWPEPRRLAAALAILLGVVYLGTLAAYQFETRRIPASELADLRARGVSAPFVAAAHVFQVVPVATPMWTGVVSLFQSNSDGAPVYLMGKERPGGTPWYFLAALAVKVPVALQILFVLSVIVFAARTLRNRFKLLDLAWLVPPLLYLGLASMSSLQLGVRLVLPALPFALLLCGYGLHWLMWGRRRLVAVALFAWLCVRVATLYPHTISFFNSWAGGPENGLEYLADSNLDWGQDLRDLAAVVHQSGIPKINLSYFGNDIPQRFFSEKELNIIVPPWTEEFAGSGRLSPEPGYYAISATLLPGHFFPQYPHFYDAFRRMKPVAIGGYSIYIYKVDGPVERAAK